MPRPHAGAAFPAKAEGHAVRHLQRAGGRGEGGDEDVGVVEVLASGLEGAFGAYSKGAPPLHIEDAAEHRGRVEPGKARPVDGAVAAHERCGVAIAQQGVILNPLRHPASHHSGGRPVRPEGARIGGRRQRAVLLSRRTT